jgi:phosphohistidine phosphatase
VLCSSARRTRETLEPIAATLGAQVPLQIENELYAASERCLLERVRAVEDGVESVMLIGHNPGVPGLSHRPLSSTMRHGTRWATCLTRFGLVSRR